MKGAHNNDNVTMPMQRTAITKNDRIVVKGRYLYHEQSQERFFIKGMAFPIPLPPPRKGKYDVESWKKILDQLANDIPDLNTVRVYELDCHHNHAEFLDHAAQLGIYVMVPLTGSSGSGVLDRNSEAPKCYPQKLFEYGKRCLDQYGADNRHPNVIGGLVGNEVMNSPPTWTSAPCVHAYARDLKLYQQRQMMKKDADSFHYIPLIYATQHDASLVGGPQISPSDAMKVTLDALACVHDDDVGDSFMRVFADIGGDTMATTSVSTAVEDSNITTVTTGGIDIFGVNIESWCSSRQTFHYDEDGFTESAYYKLYQAMLNTTTIPLIFTEMGCSKKDFNRDNGLEPQGYRDWKQVPVVLDEMSPIFSGFCVYAYDGNPDFRMMADGSPWDGHGILEPSNDYDNFAKELAAFAENGTSQDGLSKNTMPIVPTCSEVWQELSDITKLSLYPPDQMPSRVDHFRWSVAAECGMIGILFCLLLFGLYKLCTASRSIYGSKNRDQNGIYEGLVASKVQQIQSKPDYQSIA